MLYHQHDAEAVVIIKKNVDLSLRWSRLFPHCSDIFLLPENSIFILLYSYLPFFSHLFALYTTIVCFLVCYNILQIWAKEKVDAAHNNNQHKPNWDMQKPIKQRQHVCRGKLSLQVVWRLSGLFFHLVLLLRNNEE